MRSELTNNRGQNSRTKPALREQPASYFNETDYFEADWQQAFWGDHYARLLQVKERYDPGGLFFVHHGVGTDT